MHTVTAALLLRCAGAGRGGDRHPARSLLKADGGASRPPEVEANLVAYGRKYWCVECNCGFDKMKNWESHVAAGGDSTQVARATRAAAEGAAAGEADKGEGRR